MSNLFVVTAKYDKMQENGILRTVKEQYLVDAMSFTEAEARVTQLCSGHPQGEFEVTHIVKPRIEEFYQKEGAEKFYRAKSAYIGLDEKTGEEKLFAQADILQADSFGEAYKRLEEALSQGLGEHVIRSITEIPIVEYLQHDQA